MLGDFADQCNGTKDMLHIVCCFLIKCLEVTKQVLGNILHINFFMIGIYLYLKALTVFVLPCVLSLGYVTFSKICVCSGKIYMFSQFTRGQ